MKENVAKKGRSEQKEKRIRLKRRLGRFFSNKTKQQNKDSIRFLTPAAQPLTYIVKRFIVLLGLLPLTQPLCTLFDTDLVPLVDPWKLPVMRLLSQVVKVAVG